MSNSSYFKKVPYLLKLVMIGGFLLSLFGCKELGIGVEKVKPGNIYFIDYKDVTKIRGGNEGLIDFGGKKIGIGDKDVKTLKIKNSGTGDLIIKDMFFKGDVFNFVEGTNPDFPIIIPAGKTIDNIYLEFNPKTSGKQTSQFFIVTGTVTHNFDLTGIGLWVLTLKVAAGSHGKITSPVEVLPGGPDEDVTSSTGVFNLSCKIDDFYGFKNWVIDSAVIDPVFENVNAMETTVVLNSHTTISMNILQTYIVVDGTSIQTAINTCSADDTLIGVVVRRGTYNEDLTLKYGAPVYGGYHYSTTDRKYLTDNDRNLSGYKTEIVGTITASGAPSDKNILLPKLEGFIINGNVSFTSDTKAVLQYNTIIANGATSAVTIDNSSNLIQNNVITGGTGAAVEITNSSSPDIENNDITGGTNSGDDSKTYGIKVSQKSSPFIYKNNISGGSSSGLRGQAYGIFNDFECNPEITGNTINGGSAAGDSGKTYGVYLINNGKGTIGYNDINGSNGKSAAYALYVAYGGNLYLDYNNIHTSGGSNGYGIYIGWQGRVRRLLNNGIYDADAALLSVYLPDSSYGTIEEVNKAYHTETNKGSKITIPAN